MTSRARQGSVEYERIPFLVLGVIFAIKKKHELTYFTYLKLNHIYNKKIKELPNRQIKITDDGEDE